MGQTSSAPTFDAVKTWRELRDTGMQSWARIALQLTSSEAYSRVSSILARPGLYAAGVLRKETERAMASLLAYANLPSRAEVLQLSTRLTHIEMALDDLAAAVESLRTASARPPATGKRAASGERASRHNPRSEG